MWKYSAIMCESCKYLDDRYNVKYCDSRLNNRRYGYLSQLGCPQYEPVDPMLPTTGMIQCPTCKLRRQESDGNIIMYSCPSTVYRFTRIYCRRIGS